VVSANKPGTGQKPGKIAESPSQRFNFTVEELKALRPRERLYWVWDTVERRLCMSVNPGGKKTFFFRYWVGRRSYRHKLGVFPGLGVKAARKKADALHTPLAEGKNPAEERAEARAELTVAELLERYVVDHLEQRRKPKSAASARQLARDYLAPIGRLRLSELTRPRVVKLHSDLGAKSRSRANRALEVLSAACRWAIKRSLAPAAWHDVAPTYGVETNPETKRDRFLSADELGRFLRALDDEPADLRDFFLMLLFTGARRGNVQAMQWAAVDLAGGVWTIPASEAKAGETLSLALVPPAVEILKRRREELRELAASVGRLQAVTRRLNFREQKHRNAEIRRAQHGEKYVFPGVGKLSGHLNEPKKAWVRVLDRAGIPAGRDADNGVVMHDVRRTLGSWLAGQGVSLPIVGKALGHRSVAATQVYARLNLDPVRAALEKVIVAFHAAREQAERDAEKVSPMREAK